MSNERFNNNKSLKSCTEVLFESHTRYKIFRPNQLCNCLTISHSAEKKNLYIQEKILKSRNHQKGNK